MDILPAPFYILQAGSSGLRPPDARGGRIPRHKQVLSERAGGFAEISCHRLVLLFCVPAGRAVFPPLFSIFLYRTTIRLFSKALFYFTPRRKKPQALTLLWAKHTKSPRVPCTGAFCLVKWSLKRLCGTRKPQVGEDCGGGEGPHPMKKCTCRSLVTSLQLNCNSFVIECQGRFVINL